MDKIKSENKIIQNKAEQKRMIDLFLLKSATAWLEKQDWISSPYGGENYLQDMIFRIKHLSSKEWEGFFADGKTPENPGELKEYFELLKTIDPSIKDFCDSVLKNK